MTAPAAGSSAGRPHCHLVAATPTLLVAVVAAAAGLVVVVAVAVAVAVVKGLAGMTSVSHC